MCRLRVSFWGGPRPKMSAVGCYRAALRRATEPRLRVSAHSGNAPSAGPRWLRCCAHPATKTQHEKPAGSALGPACIELATVLVAVKTMPAASADAAGLDGHCARWRGRFAGSGRKDGPGRTKGLGLAFDPGSALRLLTQKEPFKVIIIEGNRNAPRLEWSRKHGLQRSSRNYPIIHKIPYLQMS